MSTDPRWPSLYNWNIELWPLEGKDPVQPGGVYLTDHNQVFHFTLYWTLIFYVPAYILCATYAFLNVSFPLSRHSNPHAASKRYPSKQFLSFSSYHPAPIVTVNEIPLTPALSTSAKTTVHPYVPLSKPNEKRSRLTLALLVFLAYAFFALVGVVIGSAIIGYCLAGLYEAGNFHMSTWIPFVAGVLQTLVNFLGLWPSVVDII